MKVPESGTEQQINMTDYKTSWDRLGQTRRDRKIRGHIYFAGFLLVTVLSLITLAQWQVASSMTIKAAMSFKPVLH